jgi:uncharacterized repeat protein (TIGR04138 family)
MRRCAGCSLSNLRLAAELIRGPARVMSLPPMEKDKPTFPDIVILICKEDRRYDRRAYEFVRLGLDHTVKELRKKEAAKAEANRHVSGPELLDGLRIYALDQYGPLAKTVLNSWGVGQCRDFGEIVFNLIDYKVFSKTESDRREDFDGRYSFEEAFVRPFIPSNAAAAGAVGSA